MLTCIVCIGFTVSIPLTDQSITIIPSILNHRGRMDGEWKDPGTSHHQHIDSNPLSQSVEPAKRTDLLLVPVISKENNEKAWECQNGGA